MNMKQNKFPARRLPVRIATPAIMLAIAVFGSLPAAARASTDVERDQVGEVSLVLGKAWLNKPGGIREVARAGTAVHAGDSIETATNGHVHVRFVDAALVSVRPSSSLEIVRYDYDPASPADSAVKLNLVEGVTRAISGEAAKEARANFRMNTPIAAIGVRGTDFVVSADQRSVRALVNEGAIVVAPFSSQCLADALGPCSLNGLELAGGLDQVVQISGNGGEAVLLPRTATGFEQEMLGRTLAQTTKEQEADEAESEELYAETVTARAVNPRLAQAAPVTRSPALIPEFTPDAPVTASVLGNAQLVWGRWTEGNLADERITVSFMEALSGGREGTVGNNSYGLFRTEAGSKSVQPGLGVLVFGLTQAQANYRDQAGVSLMDVNGGSLNLDLDVNRYSTTLRLNHAATGAVTIDDSGRIFAGGYFHNRTDTQVTAGAVSLDGREAGYFFEKTLEQGSIDGLTLWSRLP